MSDVPTLRTPRLVLREFRQSDAEPYARMCADAEVMRYLRGTPIDAAEAWREMAMFAGHWQLRGFGMWVVEERASRLFAGRIGLHYPEGWPDRELGWTLAREFWGRGYAFEGAQAALAHAFGTLNWPRIISLIHPENQRSRRLAERLGIRLEQRVDVRGVTVDTFALERRKTD